MPKIATSSGCGTITDSKTGNRFSLPRAAFWANNVGLCGEIPSEVSHQPELEAGGVAHHALVPHRVPHHLDVHVGNTGHFADSLLGIGGDHATHAATGRGKSHF